MLDPMVLAFPSLLRGALDTNAECVSAGMCLAAVHTIANDLPENELSKPTFRTVSERVGRYLEESSTRVASGFSLNGGVVADAHERKKLERLCRYITRPAIAETSPETETGTTKDIRQSIDN